MGVIQRGILGGFSGKVANVIGSSWKGIAVMKSMPLSVANPNTAAQVVQRTRMSNVVEFAKAILVSTIKPLNDRWASGMSGFNLFVSRNIALFDLANPVVYSDLILSLGNVTGPATFYFTSSIAGNFFSIWFDNNTGVGNALATDEGFIVAMNIVTGDIITLPLTTRVAAGTSIPVPAGWLLGHTVRVWMSFRRADGTQVSNNAFSTGNIAA